MSANQPKDKSSQSDVPDVPTEEPVIINNTLANLHKIMQIISPILIPLVIALMGYWGQKTITELSVQEQNSRLYTELLSRREESESALRKDMFKEIMNGFFTDITITNQSSDLVSDIDSKYRGEDIKDKLSKKILKLEMLALNFGDSLSIGPLFSELSNDIEHILKANANVIDNWMVVAAPYQKRLRSLAKRVASRQLSTISAGSETPDRFEFKISAHLKEIDEKCVEQKKITNGAAECKIVINNIEKGAGTNHDVFWNSQEEIDSKDNLNLDGVARSFEITISNADLINHTIDVELLILETFKTQKENEDGKENVDECEKESEDKNENEGEVKKENEDEVKKENEGECEDNKVNSKQIVVAKANFSMDFFNFPLIDNTRLSNNHRFALIMEDFDHKTVELKGVLFPGSFASHRDKPFLNDAINELKINKDNK